MLDEIFLRVVFKCHPLIKYFFNFDADLGQHIIQLAILFAEIHVLDFFSEEKIEQNVGT